MLPSFSESIYAVPDDMAYEVVSPSKTGSDGCAIAGIVLFIVVVALVVWLVVILARGSKGDGSDDRLFRYQAAKSPLLYPKSPSELHDADAYFFNMKSCVHCKKMVAALEKAVRETGKKIMAIDVQDSAFMDLIREHEVNAVPLLKRLTGEVYSGDRSAPSIVAFMQ